MAKMKKPVQVECVPHYHGKKKMFMGLLVFVFGLILYLGYTWDIALMVVGALMFLKGLLMKAK